MNTLFHCRTIPSRFASFIVFLHIAITFASAQTNEQAEVIRVFIFAGQSNMEGADSKIDDVQNFPPFIGATEANPDVLFSYSLGRDNKSESQGWVPLQSVRDWVGPELTFARELKKTVDFPIAIIKCAAGGTHLGGDWNPDNPSGFKLYPHLRQLVSSSLAALDAKGLPYRIEGFMWHQGENDMFEKDYLQNYGRNLKNFIEHCRRDLESPNLRFYIGELCTKTIWGMDLRPRMYAISLGQREVTNHDPLAEYVPTSHIGVEIGHPVGLHYHYGTLGQLEHGVNYAHAYLKAIDQYQRPKAPSVEWPQPKSSKLKLYILAGHRNMEGERAFLQELPANSPLRDPKNNIPFHYSLGGGVQTSSSWEPLRPSGYYDTFGPELSFGERLQENDSSPFAIAKYTHSGSQIIDWTPEGSEAKARNLYSQFIRYIKARVADLEAKGHAVQLEGIFYHMGENDMSFYPYRRDAAKRLKSIVEQSRIDLRRPKLKWYVSQQTPTNEKGLNRVDPVAEVMTLAEADPHFYHLRELSFSKQDKELVLDTEAVLQLGYQIADYYLERIK